MSEIKDKLKRIQQMPKENRFERYVGTSKGLLGVGPPSYTCNSRRHGQDALSDKQKIVGNKEFSSGIHYPYSCDDYLTWFEAQNRYQHDSHKHGRENYSNSQYLSQGKGKPSWENYSNSQYQKQWQCQPSTKQNRGKPSFQYHSQWQGQPLADQNRISECEPCVTSLRPTLYDDKIQARIGDKAPKIDLYEPKTDLYGRQAPTSLPGVITLLKGKMDIEQIIMADLEALKKEDLASDLIVENGHHKGLDVDAIKASDLIVENGHHKGLDVVSSNCRLPLVWIDLEMTGLDIETDRILEIACIITDGSLTKLIEGPDIVIHQKKECLDKMGEWCQKHHAASGLTDKVTRSLVTEREAEKQVIEFVKKNVGGWTTYYRPLLAGNSVYVDLLFLKKYMPELASLFCHVLVDVSSINALCLRWFTKEHRNAPKKERKHRAMDDIKESIAELKYYKDAIFKPSELDTLCH